MEIVESVFDKVEVTEVDQRLMTRGKVYDHSTMLIDGYAMRTIDHGAGEQIVGFQVAGDFMDLHAFALKRLDHNIVTLGTAKVAYVPHERLEEVMVNEPHLARLLWFSTLLDAAIHREWIMKLGQLRALGRAAHFFSEVYSRLQMVDRAEKLSFSAPLTQLHVANICGTTPVHINRVLRDLRESGAAEFKRGQVEINDLAKLHDLAGSDASYLYGEGDLAVQHELSKQF